MEIYNEEEFLLLFIVYYWIIPWSYDFPWIMDYDWFELWFYDYLFGVMMKS